ncbi:MAG TPA: hypothetical protein VH164_16315 [Ktedonobacteraceae bacterium]|nr:hypothetical protein [Ktedonobacteraceae bacterium]
MQSRRIVVEHDGYVITEAGRLAWRTAPNCDCKPRIAGLLVVCTECGTVWGHLKDSLNWGSGFGGSKR